MGCKRLIMRPSHSELVELNPRLGKRSPTEVDALLCVIEECGYTWEPSDQRFYNPEIGRGLRTQGLDYFTPDQFRTDHASRIADIQKDPQGYEKYQLGMRLWQSHWGKFLWVFVLTLIGGWLLFPFEYWLGILGLIAVSFWIFKKYTFWLICSYSGGFPAPDDLSLDSKEDTPST